jgi:hypothetical protein
VQLIVANAIRLATVNVVGGVLLFLGKVAVAAGCGLVALSMSRMPYYNDASAYPATHLSSAILPIAVAVVTGYIVAQVGGQMRRGGSYDESMCDCCWQTAALTPHLHHTPCIP